MRLGTSPNQNRPLDPDSRACRHQPTSGCSAISKIATATTASQHSAAMMAHSVPVRFFIGAAFFDGSDVSLRGFNVEAVFASASAYPSLMRCGARLIRMTIRSHSALDGSALCANATGSAVLLVSWFMHNAGRPIVRHPIVLPPVHSKPGRSSVRWTTLDPR